jgi:multidrug transporter EmrE-like cation transporter
MPSFESLMPSLGFRVSASTTTYAKLLACAVLAAAAELCLKVGATAGASTDATLHFSALAQAGTWLGIVFFIANFVLWLDVLRTTPVGIAFAVQSVVQLLVPVAAWAFLHEQISAGRALGIGLVFTGVLLAAAPSALAEERL